MRRVPRQAMRMPKAWPAVASALNAELGWWQCKGVIAENHRVPLMTEAEIVET